MSLAVRHTLEFLGKKYDVEIGAVGIVLTGPDRLRYHVHRKVDPEIGEHVACTCPDYQHKKRGTTDRCKHGRAAESAGLV